MPREDRQIYFSYEETYKAINLMCRQKEMPLPPSGEMKDAHELTESPSEIAVIVANHRIGEDTIIRYTKDFIIAALMFRCRNIGIPLPKGANKTLELDAKKVVLRTHMVH